MSPTTRPETWTVWTHTDEEYKHELGAYSAGASMDDRITSDAIRELLDARAELSLALELLKVANECMAEAFKGKSVSPTMAVMFIRKLDASGLLGEIGGTK